MTDELMNGCKNCGSANIMLFDVRGVYDGILYTECQDCLYKHHRFQDKQISKITWLGDYRVEFLFSDNTKCVNKGA